MRSWKARWRNRPALLRGRLHGRALKLLGGFVVVFVAIAVWQLAAALGGDDGAESGGGNLSEPMLSTMPEDSDPGSEDTSATATAEPSATVSESASPTEEADEESTDPEPAPEDTEESGPACTATLHLDSEWANSISVTVEVANTGPEAFDGWEVVLAIEDVEITASWGMDHIEGDRYGNGWVNGDLDPGETTEPSFNATAKGNYSLPETVPCTPV